MPDKDSTASTANAPVKRGRPAARAADTTRSDIAISKTAPSKRGRSKSVPKKAISDCTASAATASAKRGRPPARASATSECTIPSSTPASSKQGPNKGATSTRKKGRLAKSKQGRSISRPVKGATTNDNRNGIIPTIDDDDDDEWQTDEENEEEAPPAWNQDPTPPKEIKFTATPGMKGPLPKSPLEFIQLFITREMLEYISVETNNYAEWSKEFNHDKTCDKWKGCDIEDIAKYLGLRILMGINKNPEEEMHWNKDEPYGHHVFWETMKFNKFKLISKFIHAYNKKAVPENNEDRLLLVRPILDFLCKRAQEVYVPEKFISLDEGMMPWKGKLSIKVYNPLKPTKYGVKIYLLCEAKTGYVLDLLIYQGKKNTLRQIVWTLMQRYFNKGYCLYMDNYYNTVDIADQLYENGVHVTGTLRLPRGAPKDLQTLGKKGGKKLPRDAYHYRRRNNTFVSLWQDTRPVPMISTKFGTQRTKTTVKKRVKKQGRYQMETTEVNKPNAILDYCQYMGGVDIFDQKMNYYKFYRKTAKWTKKILMYLLQMGLQNAHILYNKYSTEKKLSLLKFHEEAWKALVHFDSNKWPSNPDLKIPHAVPTPATLHSTPAVPPTPATPAAPLTPLITALLTPVTCHRNAGDNSIPTPTPAVPTYTTHASPHRNAVYDPPPTPTPATPSAFLSPLPGVPSPVTPHRNYVNEPPTTTTPRVHTPTTPITPHRNERDNSTHTPTSASRSWEKIVDPDCRFDKKKQHIQVAIGYKDKGERKIAIQLRCRVCKKVGEKLDKKKRTKDTSWKCSVCDIPLCATNTGRRCYYVYHKRIDFWNPRYLSVTETDELQ